MQFGVHVSVTLVGPVCITVTDDDLQAFYAENKDRYIAPARRRARHILRATEADAGAALARAGTGSGMGGSSDDSSGGGGRGALASLALRSTQADGASLLLFGAAVAAFFYTAGRLSMRGTVSR